MVICGDNLAASIRRPVYTKDENGCAVAPAISWFNNKHMPGALTSK